MKKQIGLFTAILFVVSTLMMACKAEVHTHTFSSKWTSDETNHWHEATCEHKDKVIDRAKHTFGDWITTKEATEEAEGSKETNLYSMWLYSNRINCKIGTYTQV